MTQLELFECMGDDSRASSGPVDDYDEEEALRIDDDDGGTESDADVCDTCDCLRSHHEDGKGACSCGRCKRYKDPG